MHGREIEENELDATPLSKRLQPHRQSSGRLQSKLDAKSVKGKKKFAWSTNPSTGDSDKSCLFVAYNFGARESVC